MLIKIEQLSEFKEVKINPSTPASLSSGKSNSTGIINYLLVTLIQIRFSILNGEIESFMYILHWGGIYRVKVGIFSAASDAYN